jgi:hypothetical protein
MAPIAIGEGHTLLAGRIVTALVVSPCIWFMFASFAYGPAAFMLSARVDLQPDIGLCAMNMRPENDSAVAQSAPDANAAGMQVRIGHTESRLLQQATIIHSRFVSGS